MKEYITGIQHIGLPTQKLEETLCFYEALGFERSFQTSLCLAERQQRVCFLKRANLVMEVYEEKVTAGAPGAIDHIALDVTDIDKVFDEVQALGYKSLEGEVKELPFWEKGVRFFTISGPNGEKVEFSQML